MEKDKIFICGNFGYKSGELGGQTIKTRVLNEALIRHFGRDNVVISDTSEWKKNPFSLFLKIRKNFINSEHIIVLPARKGARVLLPIFAYWKKRFKKDVRYVVIGGWLPAYGERFKSVLNALREFDGIYIETRAMKQRLNRLGLKKVKVMPNFRLFDRVNTGDMKNTVDLEPPTKAVIVTRIIKDKGIDIAIEAINKLNQRFRQPAVLFREPTAIYDKPFTLHIYGQIYRGYKKEFKKLMSSAGQNAEYMGHIEPERVIETLRGYDIMLLPTRYDGEGFPGAVIEAFAAGVPVVLSDWQYNKEVVDENETGIIFDINNVDKLVDKLEYLALNPDKLNEMSIRCIEKAKEFHVDHVINTLLNDLK